jgi:hypothetical protein
MKKRITLTIRPEISQRAKMLARTRNSSVSHLVETLIEQASSSEASSASTRLAERWRGKLKTDFRDEPRSRYLKKKYDL